MAKNDNAHSVRLIDSLRSNTADDAADIEKKFEWAKNVCDNLKVVLYNFPTERTSI